MGIISQNISQLSRLKDLYLCINIYIYICVCVASNAFGNAGVTALIIKEQQTNLSNLSGLWLSKINLYKVL